MIRSGALLIVDILAGLAAIAIIGLLIYLPMKALDGWDALLRALGLRPPAPFEPERPPGWKPPEDPQP